MAASTMTVERQSDNAPAPKRHTRSAGRDRPRHRGQRTRGSEL